MTLGSELERIENLLLLSSLGGKFLHPVVEEMSLCCVAINLDIMKEPGPAFYPHKLLNSLAQNSQHCSV